MWLFGDEVTVDAPRAVVAPAPASARGQRHTRAGIAPAWLRERLATTPGRLILISILVILGAVCFGVLATTAEQSRERAARAARTQTEPMLAQALNLYTALSDANATVATGLLAGGIEPPAKRARYLHDVHVASGALSALTREAGNSPTTQAALGTVAAQLPLYTGLVETARANNRQEFPIGAAYVRQAATLLTGNILPAAERLYATEAQRLNDDYRAGTSTSALVAFVIAIVVALGLLVYAQRYVARISHRILNVAMVVATVALAAVSTWGVIGMIRGQNALASAQRDGSDPIEVLSAGNILLSRAQGDESLALVNRGSDQRDRTDFEAVMRTLGPSPARDAVITELSALAGRTGMQGAGRALASDFARYRAETGQINRLQDRGQLIPALRSAPAASSISDRMTANLTGQIAAAQSRFASAARSASSDLDGLSVAIPLIAALTAVLAVFGLRQRIIEFR